MLRGYKIMPREEMLFSNGVNCAGVFYAKRSGHRVRLAYEKGNVKPQDLTP